MNYILSWTPSPSTDVDYQEVTIENLGDGEVIAKEKLPATAQSFIFQCRDGITIKATVVAIRGEERAGASVTYQTKPEPLMPPADLGVREAEGPVIQPIPG